jgi:hypothetical protein
LGLLFGLVQSTLTEDLGMKCVSVIFVPKLPTVNKKETCPAVARDLLQCADQRANFMNTMITSDKSWVYGYNQKYRNKSPGILMEVSRVSMAKKERPVQSKATVMLTVFFNHKGNVHHEHAPDCQLSRVLHQSSPLGE